MGVEKLESIINNVNTLILNEANWNLLKKSTPTLDSPKSLLNLGPKEVIITRGSKEVKVYTINETFEVPPFKVKAVDTTGAGDAFVAGYIKARLEGKSLREAIKYALAVAAITTTKLGVRTSLPRADQVEDFIKNYAPTP